MAGASRHAVLGRIRAALGGATAAGPPAPGARNTVPELARTTGAARRRRFAEQVEASAASLESRAGWAELPAACAAFAAAHSLPRHVRRGSTESLEPLDWANAGLASLTGPAEAGDSLGVVAAEAGVAETGQLVLASRAGQPASLFFLPANLVIAVAAADLVGGWEDAWDLLRRRSLAGPAGARAVHFVAGPSRSADIEQTLQLGAHGPKRVHVVIVEA